MSEIIKNLKHKFRGTSLIDSIYIEPEKWRVSSHTMIHKSGAQLWVGNGFLCCEPHPGGKYGLLNKRRAWKAYLWWCETAPVEAFGNRSAREEIGE